METTTLEIRNEYGTYTVKVNKTDLTSSEMIEMFIGVMVSATYSESKLIEEFKQY